MIFEQGDIIEVSFDPTLGHEPQKTRPALVVSTTSFNLISSLTVVAPITTTYNGYPMHVRITASDSEIYGCICVEQIRAIDLSARNCRKVGILSDNDMSEVLNRVGAVFGI